MDGLMKKMFGGAVQRLFFSAVVFCGCLALLLYTTELNLEQVSDYAECFMKKTIGGAVFLYMIACFALLTAELQCWKLSDLARRIKSCFNTRGYPFDVEHQSRVESQIVHAVMSSSTTFSEIKNFLKIDESSRAICSAILENLVFQGKIGIYPGGIVYWQNSLDRQTLGDIYRNRGLCYFTLWIVEGVCTRGHQMSQDVSGGNFPERRNQSGILEFKAKQEFEDAVEAKIIRRGVKWRLVSLKRFKRRMAGYNAKMKSYVEEAVNRIVLRGKVSTYEGMLVYHGQVP